MEIDCVKPTPNFSNKLYQIYPFQSPLLNYILSKASLPTQIKLSKACKDLHEKLYKRHNIEVDNIWVKISTSTYYLPFNGKVYLYPTPQFLLQLKHLIIATKSVILFNVADEQIEQVFAKIDYSSVEEFYFSCCKIDFMLLKKILKIPTLKLISYWSSNVINAGEIDIEDYISDNFPNVYIHDPD